jgi:uncharacterized repeat protein (TIGR01451 family)
MNLWSSGGAAATLRSERGRRRLAISAMVVFMLSVLVQYASFAGAPSALAVHDEGIFELDGNAVDQGGVDGDDWEDGTPGAADTLFISGDDEADGADTSYFKGGGSKDHLNLNNWEWSATDVAPDKDELLDVFAAVYEDGSDTVVYFGADKFDDSGDAQIGYWFFQDNVSTDSDGTFNGLHTEGDVLVLSDFTNGGEVDLICVYEWNPPGDNIAAGVPQDTGCDVGNNVTLVAAGAECDVTSADGTFDVCAIVNNGTETAPWAFENKDGDTDFAKGQFFEGGINLSQLFGGDAPCFSTFLAETRSSQEVEAQLKDFALGSLDTCVPPDLETDSSVSDADFGEEVTDLATLSGSHGAVEGTITFFICGPDLVNSNGCESGQAEQVGDPVEIENDEAESEAYDVGVTEDAVGTYCWRAEYTPSADSEYLETEHTNATSECFEVAAADIDVEKVADDASVLAGEQIGFIVTVSNDGDNTALGISFTDDLPGGAGIDWSIDDQSGSDFSITGTAPNQSLDFAPTSLAGGASSWVHIVSDTTAASCGAYDNTAEISTTSDGSDDASDSTFVACPGLAIVKTDGDATYSAVGDVIHYSITATNTGNVTLHDVVVTDPNAVNLVCDPALPVADLEPGDEIDCTAEHVVTQDDLDAGSYLNTACVDDEMGAEGEGAEEACDDEDTPGEQNPALDIVKGDGDATYSAVGDVIHYTIVATNTGNVTLHDVVITDPNAVNLVCDPALPVADLAPTEEISCTAEHVVTQDDIDAGSYLNTACVDDEMGEEGAGADEACDDENTPGSQNPELSIVKDDAGATYDEVGDVIHYTIVATNIGNVTLKGVVVTDPNVTDLVCDPATPVDLAPGESIECTASHTVTQADLDAGIYLNTACANDTDGPAAEVCDDEDTPGSQNPALAIDKQVTDTLFTEAGQILHYTIVVTNVGNVTLKNVVVTDELVSDLECEPDLPVPTLAVGASFTCTATYTIVESDFDTLVVTNVACADDGMGDGEVGADPVCDEVQTPGQEVEEETSPPTQPPTDAIAGDSNSAPSNGAWILVLGLAIVLSTVVFMTPARKRSRM